MKTKIINAWILTINDKMDVYQNGEIVYEDDLIIYVGEKSDLEVDHIIDARGGIVMPGMINTHCHVSMVPFRSLGDDCKDRLRRFLFPLERECMNKELTYLSAKYGIAEMLKGGITCFVDMYYFMDEVAKACKEMGIRALLGETIIEQETPDSQNVLEGLKLAEDFIQKWQDDKMISPMIAPHATNTNSTQTFQKVMSLCKKYDVMMTTHASEMDYEMDYFKETYQMTPIEWLDSIGCLNEYCLLAHAIHTSDDDIDLISKKGASIAHCVVSNMKAGKGIMPLAKMLDSNINVGLGTDGASSGNNLSLFNTLRLVPLAQKTKYHDRSLLSALEVVKLSTIGGAKAIHKEHLIGSLEVGKQADIIIVSLDDIHMFPVYDLYSVLVYSANQNDVSDVIVAGKHLVEKHILVNDIKSIKEDLAKAMEGFKQRALEKAKEI